LGSYKFSSSVFCHGRIYGLSVTFQARMRSTFPERIDVFETLAAQGDRSVGERRPAASEGLKEGGCADVLACGKRE
jgi:hypothetical protein